MKTIRRRKKRKEKKDVHLFSCFSFLLLVVVVMHVPCLRCQQGGKQSSSRRQHATGRLRPEGPRPPWMPLPTVAAVPLLFSTTEIVVVIKNREIYIYIYIYIYLFTHQYEMFQISLLEFWDFDLSIVRLS